MSRLEFLLTEASEAFEDMRNPFDTAWLVEHNVTADECFELSSAVSAAIDLFVVTMQRSTK